MAGAAPPATAPFTNEDYPRWAESSAGPALPLPAGRQGDSCQAHSPATPATGMGPARAARRGSPGRLHQLFPGVPPRPGNHLCLWPAPLTGKKSIAMTISHACLAGPDPVFNDLWVAPQRL